MKVTTTKGVFTRLLKSIVLISLILVLGACSTELPNELSSELPTDTVQSSDSTGIDTSTINYRDGLSINYKGGLATQAVDYNVHDNLDNNLLANNDFKTTDAWSNCGDASAYGIAKDSLTMNGPACVYQTIPATAGEEYTLVCDSEADTAYSEIILSMLDSNYSIIEENIEEITAKNLSNASIVTTAPTGTVYTAVVFYSEGGTRHNSCTLATTDTVTPVDPTPVDPTPVDPTPSNELLANPGFNTNTDWFNCGNAANSNISHGVLTLSGDSACVFQTLVADPEATYSLACDSTSSAAYSNVTLSMLDAHFATIKAETVAVDDMTAQPSVLTNLKSTNNTAYVGVTIYSEGAATHESCSLTSDFPIINPDPIEPTPVTPVEPITPVTPVEPTPVEPTPITPAPVTPAPITPANTLLANPSFDGTDSWTVCAGDNQGNYGIGTGSLLAAGTACAFQTVPVTDATEYTLVCNAKSDALTSNISLSMLDANFDTIINQVEPITSATLGTVTLKLDTVANASFVSVTLYNDEGTAEIADCGLVGSSW